MPAPVLYYIRHGETAWNAEGRFQGGQDIPLNDRGRKQATAAGSILRDLLARDGCGPQSLDYVCSPLGRARVTMDLLRVSLDLPRDGYALDSRLREIAFGDWEGLTLAEMKLRDDVTYASRDADKWGTAAPAGETYAAVTLRIGEWYSALKTDTVAVAHGGTMRALLVATGIATPLEAADMRVEQGVVYVLAGGAMNKYG